MGYESLSAIVVLVIVAILMVCWLPKKTINGMTRVAEHREDRLSSSLHLVDANSGTRFSDAHTMQAKGAVMPVNETRRGGLSSEHIAQVRAERHAAVQRRRRIVVLLLIATFVVLALSFALKFSALFALIPAAATAGVVALGVRAAQQARQWEARVANIRAARHKRASQLAMQRAQQRPRFENDHAAQDAEQALLAQHFQSNNNPTDVMETNEIRRAIELSRLEKAEASVRREQQSHDVEQVVEQLVENSGNTSANVDAVSVAGQQVAQNAQPEMVDSAEIVESSAADASQYAQREPVEPSLSVHDERDLTAEMSQVSLTRVQGVVDHANTQDLISFSLGAPRSGQEPQIAEPQSMEIKSSRQVAKAVPVEPLIDAKQDEDDALEAPSAQDDAVDAVADAAREAEREAFHESEMEADVEAPAITEESLGTGLEAILARRVA